MKVKEQTIKLYTAKNNGSIDFIGGSNPYLWIGNEDCFGCIPYKSVKKLRDMCNAILECRSSNK